MMTRGTVADRVREFDWDCAHADTQYLTHAIHRYSGKFIPQIARQAIEILTEPGEIVLDPYCGSGTALLEAALLGRRAVGVDLNPLAVLIARAKTRGVPPACAEAVVRRFERGAGLLSGAPGAPSLYHDDTCDWSDVLVRAGGDPRRANPWYRKWFRDGILRELIALDLAIRSEPCVDCRRLAQIAMSDVLRKCSNANGSYPNLMFDRRKPHPAPVVPRFLDRLGEIARSVVPLNEALAGRPVPVVVRGDARRLPIESRTIHAVVTHPPYIGSIPYAEYGLLSLTWLGHDARALDRELTGGRRQSRTVVQDFASGYREMFVECRRVLKPGCHLCLLVGNPVVRGTRIDLVAMTRQLAEAEGFTLAAEQERRGTNRRANLMGAETLLVFAAP
jgi:site-specific DNA-methyltransferase (cytosine-N4-specific)